MEPPPDRFGDDSGLCSGDSGILLGNVTGVYIRAILCPLNSGHYGGQ